MILHAVSRNADAIIRLLGIRPTPIQTAPT